MKPLQNNLFLLLLFPIFILSACEKNTNSFKIKKEKETAPISQQKVPYSTQLTAALIAGIVKEKNIKDTLFLAPMRLMPICGNEYDDPDYEKREAEAELNYIKANPYFVDSESDYKTYYNFNDKVVMTGTAFEDQIEVGEKVYKKKNHLILDLSYSKVTPDSVITKVYDWSNYEGEELVITMTRQDSIWNVAQVSREEKNE